VFVVEVADGFSVFLRGKVLLSGWLIWSDWLWM
jgi:hypothetical protein